MKPFLVKILVTLTAAFMFQSVSAETLIIRMPPDNGKGQVPSTRPKVPGASNATLSYSEGVVEITFAQSEGNAEIEITDAAGSVFISDTFDTDAGYSTYLGEATGTYFVTVTTDAGITYACDFEL